MFGVASVFIPDFRDGGSTMVVGILGCITACLGTLLGSQLFGGAIKKSVQDDVDKEVVKGGNGT